MRYFYIGGMIICAIMGTVSVFDGHWMGCLMFTLLASVLTLEKRYP